MKTITALYMAVTYALGASYALANVVSPREDSKLEPIKIKGNAFFKGDERFYIRGVDYQPGGSSDKEDPIADEEICKRDIPLFEDLGLNTIRIYHVDNSKNHDKCMKMMADAGIYLVLDVNTPKYSINREDPKASYNDVYLQSVFATVEMFAKYDNTLAFFSGNEVVNNGKTSKSAPWVKSTTRDIRSYIRERDLRQVPVGYSAADIDTNRLEMAEYMNCGTDDERSDFFAFNDYSWCSPSSIETAQWDQKAKNFTGYGIPIFLSEYGCNTNKRDFGEVEALYSEEMTGVYSGGLVYEFSQEANKYGLVKIGKGDDEPKKLDDYKALKKAFAKTDNPKGDGGYNSKGGSSKCPKKNAPNWSVDSDSIPAIPEPAKKYMKDGAGDGPGFKGGSQNAGTGSSETEKPGSGSATGTASSGDASSSGNAAAGIRAPEFGVAPLLCLTVIGLSTLFGASMIMV